MNLNFDFERYKLELFNKIEQKNNKALVFSEIINSYQELYLKNIKLLEKKELLERENFSHKKFTGYLIL